MALQFQPPPEDLINAYLNRKSPLQDMNDSVGQALQLYAQSKEKEKKDELQKQQLVSQDSANKVAKFKALADYADPDQIPALAKQYGMDFPSSVPPTPSSGTVAGMTPVEMQNQQSIPSEHPDINPVNNTVSPLIQAHAQATGWNPLDHPMPTSKAGLAKYKTSLETQKLQNDLQKPAKGPLQTVTHEQALKAGTFDPTKQILVEPPAPRLDLSTKQDQFDQKEWDKIVKDSNPNTARGSNPLGAATLIMDKANTAIQTLSKPVVTYQEASNAMSDIASIYQRGSPTQFGMQHQEYSTLYGKAQAALQSLTGKPTNALPNGIKQRLLDDVNGLKTLNGKVINRNLDYMEKAQPRIINKYKDEWTGIRQSFQSGGSDGSSGVTNSGSSDLVHLSTKDLMALRDKMTAHQSNGN